MAFRMHNDRTNLRQTQVSELAATMLEEYELATRFFGQQLQPHMFTLKRCISHIRFIYGGTSEIPMVSASPSTSILVAVRPNSLDRNYRRTECALCRPVAKPENKR